MQDEPRWLNFGMHFDFRGGRVNEEKTAEKEMCLSVEQTGTIAGMQRYTLALFGASKSPMLCRMGLLCP